MEEVILYISCQREQRETVQIHKQFENNLLEKIKKFCCSIIKVHASLIKRLVYSTRCLSVCQQLFYFFFQVVLYSVFQQLI